MFFRWMLLILPALELAGQTQQAVPIQVRPQVVSPPIRDGQVTTVYLAPRYATAIRLPEPVNSVVVGDPGSFSAEHSEREPQLVFVKPITPKPAQTNLLISTTRGLQVSLLLVSRGEAKGDGEADIDFLMRYKPSGQFIVQPAEMVSAVVPQTAALASASVTVASPNASVPQFRPDSPDRARHEYGVPILDAKSAAVVPGGQRVQGRRYQRPEHQDQPTNPRRGDREILHPGVGRTHRQKADRLPAAGRVVRMGAV